MSPHPNDPHSAIGTSAGSWLRQPALRALRIGQHLIAIVLALVGTVRAIGTGADPVAAVTVALAVLVWYGLGIALASSRLATTRTARWWLVGLALVWLAAVVVSAEFVWLAFLLWLLAGHLLGTWPSIGFSLAVFVVVALAPVLHDGALSYPTIVGPLIGGLFALGISRGYLALLRDAQERERLVVSLTRTQQEMADLQEELARTQRESGAVAERTRLARDIHDTVAQSLSSIRLLAHAAADRAPQEPTWQQIESLAGDSLTDVRRIVAALAPAELERGALAAALGRMVERFRTETGAEAELHVDDTLGPLPTSVEVALLRTAQSGLANVRQHARAHRVVLSLVDDNDLVRLDLRDDGCGFDATAWDARNPTGAGRSPASGYGLGFVRSRLRELGGGLAVESTPGEGTALSAYLPQRPTAAGQEGER